jgi:hypothetical protein
MALLPSGKGIRTIGIIKETEFAKDLLIPAENLSRTTRRWGLAGVPPLPREPPGEDLGE